MKNIDKTIKKDIGKARAYITEASGNRPALCKSIGIGVSWGNRFALGDFETPGYIIIMKILNHMKKK